MTLKELKQSFIDVVGDEDIDSYDTNDTVEKYNKAKSNSERNFYISILVLKSWKLLQNIYYKNNNAGLSEEDCYEIFLETLYYVCSHSVWLNEESSLYQDKDGFLKAMAVTIQCRKKNFINAQFRQKRFADYNALSLDGISEDCSEGYFTPYINSYGIEDNKIDKLISKYFNNKDYISAFVLDSIINFNIFDDEDGMLDIRKLRKHLRHLSDDFCKMFAVKYGLKVEEVLHSRKYFSDEPQNKLDEKLKKAFTNLKNSVIIKQIISKE